MTIIFMEKVRGHQVRVTLDDGREALLDTTTVEESPYTVGSEPDEGAWEALLAASAERRAREYALYLLSLRDYSEAELSRKLREKGHAAQAEAVAARMVELGLVNDETYARRLARECRLHKLFSRRRTVQEITLRGIFKEIAADAVDEVDAQENLTDLQQALALLGKKRYNSPVTDAERTRGSLLLQRNGYDGATVREAWRVLAAGGGEFLD